MVYAYDGTSWTAISGNLGFAVLDLIEFEGDLYAATMSPAQVLRHQGGTSWPVVWTPPDSAGQVCDFAEYNGDLYAGTAWTGPKLYRYNSVGDTFDYVGSVPGSWSGIRSMYAWEQSGYLQLGDIGMDYFGHFDGTTLYHDLYGGGSCIYDFAEFDGDLYGAAWAGQLWRSSNGTIWSVVASYSGSNIWELELFQGYLYMGNYSGNLRRRDTGGNTIDVWTAPDEIVSMLADGESVLYFGTGGEAGYHGAGSGVARVYTYDGGTPVQIFNADGTDTGGTDHAGIQCLLLPSTITVEADVKPGSFPSSVNLKNKGVTPVAIHTTTEFDATCVDPETVMLFDASDVDLEFSVFAVNWEIYDCDEVWDPVLGEMVGDGDLDLVLYFDTRDLATILGEGTVEVIIAGETYDGTLIMGTGDVRIVVQGKP